VDDLIDAARRDPDGDGDPVLRDAEPLDDVRHEDLARMNRLNPIDAYRTPSVVVSNLKQSQPRQGRRQST